MIVHDCPQRSPEWFAARLGRLTGSRAADMLAKIKTGEAAKRRDYRMELVCERLTGHSQDDGYTNKEMQRGIDCEPAAAALYEAETGNLIRSTGFVSHEHLMAGCSVDGDVDNFAGIVELKCPKSATHARYLSGAPPSEHYAQIRHNLWITRAEWCDFASFDDRFSPELQFFIVRFHAKNMDLERYADEAVKFLAEVDRDTHELQAMRTHGPRWRRELAEAAAL